MTSASLNLPRILLAALLAAALVLAGTTATADAKKRKPRKGPAGKAFYNPPKHLPKRHGKLIWQRRARGIMKLDGARTNRLVLYSSRTPQGKKIAVSGVVSVPRGKAPKGGWPVVSYAHGTTGTADRCAPSRVGKKSPVVPYVDYVDPELEEWLAAGYAVVRTDYQGLGTPGKHPYLIGRSEGRSVLDIVRAARDLRMRIGKRFLVAGHSQGGQSALFAAGMASRWTKDLRLRGTVAYAPASHLDDQFALLPAITSPHPLSGLAALVLDGASTTSKQLRPRGLLTAAPRHLWPQVRVRCLVELIRPDSFGGIAPADLLREDADTGPLLKVLAKMNPAVRAKGPILLAQGTLDTTVFQLFTDKLNGELVDRGNRVDYKLYPGVDHGEVVAAAQEHVMRFLKRRMPTRGRR